MGLKYKIKINVKGIASQKVFSLAQEKAAIQMLDWMSRGSQKSNAAPPIRTGILASSGSVFKGSKLLGVSSDIAGGKGTPLKSYSGKNITWWFNTDYATKMHEDKLNPGPYSERSAGRHPGNQWILEHLQKDKDTYSASIAAFAGKKL